MGGSGTAAHGPASRAQGKRQESGGRLGATPQNTGMLGQSEATCSKDSWVALQLQAAQSLAQGKATEEGKGERKATRAHHNESAWREGPQTGAGLTAGDRCFPILVDQKFENARSTTTWPSGLRRRAQGYYLRRISCVFSAHRKMAQVGCRPAREGCQHGKPRGRQRCVGAVRHRRPGPVYLG